MIENMDVIGSMMAFFVISLIMVVASSFRIMIYDDRSESAEIVFAIGMIFIIIYLGYTFYCEFQLV